MYARTRILLKYKSHVRVSSGTHPRNTGCRRTRSLRPCRSLRKPTPTTDNWKIVTSNTTMRDWSQRSAAHRQIYHSKIMHPIRVLLYLPSDEVCASKIETSITLRQDHAVRYHMPHVYVQTGNLPAEGFARYGLQISKSAVCSYITNDHNTKTRISYVRIYGYHGTRHTFFGRPRKQLYALIKHPAKQMGTIFGLPLVARQFSGSDAVRKLLIEHTQALVQDVWYVNRAEHLLGRKGTLVYTVFHALVYLVTYFREGEY